MSENLEMAATGNGPIQSTAGVGKPPQGADANTDIVSVNLRALEAVYFAAMLEEGQVFAAAQRLVEMFSEGLLPLGPGRAGAALYRSWKGQQARLTTAQRNKVYARAFGWPDAAASERPNRKFNELWLRFVSIVGMYSAELQVLPPEERTIGPEEVLVSGRLLAINLSAHGHGLAWFAVQDLRPEIQQVIDLLSDPEIQEVFDAKNPWQVVQKVAATELGVRPNVSRCHTRGESGTIIIRWLANRRARLLRPRFANILKHEDICEGRTAVSQNKKPNVYPTDFDLVTACEHWLAFTGTEEAQLKGDAAETAAVPEAIDAPDAFFEAEGEEAQPSPEVTVARDHSTEQVVG